MRIRKLPSGNWQAVIAIGKDGTGKCRYKSFTDSVKEIAVEKAKEYQEANAIKPKATNRAEFPRYVYAVQHNITGRIYVGSAKNIADRYKIHLSRLRHGKHENSEMQRDYNEHGENYSVFILAILKRPEENRLEFEWMDKLKTYDPRIGYNQRDPHFRKYDGFSVPYVGGVPIPNEVKELCRA